MSRGPQQIHGFVLQARPYRESSLLLECLTAEFGRIGCVARGARGPRSRLRGLLQPFGLLDMHLVGRGELKTLSGAEAVTPPPMLSAERVLYGWYLNELMLRLLARDDPHPALFSAYVHAVEGLMDVDATPALRRFEWVLLHELGFGLPDLPEAGAQRWAPGPHGTWQPAPAGVGITHATLLALASGTAPLTADQCREARQLLKPLLHRALGGRPLASSKMLQDFRARSTRS